MKTALTIAGSDSSGGAGIQADIKTMAVHGVYAMSAITSLTAQNTTGVKEIMEVSSKFLEAQLDSVFTDIVPDAIKTGMISSKENVIVISEKLKQYRGKNLVVDPVMLSTSGAKLLREEALETLKKELLPLALLITPNIQEAEILSEMKIESKEDMIACAEKMSRIFGSAILIKGGHSKTDSNDLLYNNGDIKWLYSERINNNNTHGTGCTLSSAIVSNLSKGLDLETAIIKAKIYITGALNARLDLGKGKGPLNHGFAIEGGINYEKHQY